MKILSLASARRKTERLMRFESNFSLLLVVSSDIMAMKESNTDYMEGHTIKALSTLQTKVRVQELCKSRGDRPGLSVLMSLTVSVDVKQH